MKITQTAICEWFDISRQAHNQMKLGHLLRRAEEALIMIEVRRIRESHPRMGTRKRWSCQGVVIFPTCCSP